MTLYRKYRSEKFCDLVGQEVVSHTLTNAVERERTAHAYLFCGPRGVGKTSAARILARAVNCLHPKKGEPCNKCKNCESIISGRSLDVIEIDAASHTGVEDVRELIGKIEFAPIKLKKKVYIIDEAHMLSRSAFNALLKTLEEPPSHVLFVLATTEAHKIPVTILSRCQRFDFRLGSLAELRDNLASVAKGEDLTVDEEAIDFLAKAANGSYRDSLTLFDKIINNKRAVGDAKITLAETLSVLGAPDTKSVRDFSEKLFEKDGVSAIEVLDNFVRAGGDPNLFTKFLLDYLRDELTYLIKGSGSSISSVADKSQVYDLIKRILQNSSFEVASGNISSLPLELTIFEVCGGGKTIDGVDDKGREKSAKLRTPKSKKSEKDTVSEAEFETKSNDKKQDEVPRQSDEDRTVPSEITLDALKDGWSRFISLIKPYNGHLYTFLGRAQFDRFEKNTLYIVVPYSFHKDRIEDKEARDVVAKVTVEVWGAEFKIRCSVDKKLAKRKPREKDEVENAVLDVFGGDIA